MTQTLRPENQETALKQSDVLSLLRRELQKSSTDDFKFIPQPLYSTELYQMQYLKGYKTPRFSLFDKRKENRKEHISRFIDSLGQHAGNYNLRLREFSKSVTDWAYTWYPILVQGSIRDWDEMVAKFCRKYFENEERTTIIYLKNTEQRHGEDLVDFWKKFWDLALDCYVEQGKQALVDICVTNIITEYWVHLEILSINKFSKLIEATRRTSVSVKITPPNRGRWRAERKEAPQVFMATESKSALPPRPQSACPIERTRPFNSPR